MEKEIIELYTDADMERMGLHVRRWRRILLAVAAVGLSVCIALAASTDTLNAPRMELATIAVSTVAGWFIIYKWVFTLSPARHELAHAEMLRREERERFEGTVKLTDEQFKIRKSVPVRRVIVTNGEVESRLLVCASRAEALEGLDEAVLYACHGYVAAYNEVTG